MSPFTFVTTVVLAAAVQTTAAAQIQQSEPLVQVGLFTYKADGSAFGMAYDTASGNDGTLNSVVYVSACVIGAGNRQPPADATDAWRLSGKVLSSSPEQAVVQLDWQRVLAQGQKVDAPSGSSQLTLAAGERVLLDSVIPSVLSACSPTSIGFEARYASRPFPMTGKRGGGGGAARTEPVGTGLYDVNLWLVHSAPGRDDEVLHQTLRSAPQRTAFAFAPVTIDTAGGGVIVQVTGSVTVVDAASGQKLIFQTERRVTLPQAAQSPRDTAAGAQAGISARAMPGPDEVLSFEMPPILLNGRPMVPDKFSVRVRITPR